jgi:hypothetical protein
MTSMREHQIGRSLGEMFRALWVVVRSAYSLAPAAVIVMILVAVIVVAATIWSTPLMMTVVLLIVLGIALLLYLSTWNYGEAALALAAGLLTVYSVTWTPKKFIAFVVVWLTFSAVALLASSFRVASQIETIYVGAAAAVAGHADANAIKITARELRRIADSYKGYLIGNKEKAEALRVFAFRQISIQVFAPGLAAVDTLSTALQLDVVSIANLVCDILRAFAATEAVDLSESLEAFIATLQSTAASPSDFITGFESSRHLLLGGQLRPGAYFSALQGSLEAGIAPARVGYYLEKVASDA